jgi:hypothetical protein
MVFSADSDANKDEEEDEDKEAEDKEGGGSDDASDEEEKWDGCCSSIGASATARESVVASVLGLLFC